MLINENGLARAVKYAYKHGGYSVVCDDSRMAIYTGEWLVIRDRDKMPRKVLGAIAEHAGLIPDDTPVKIDKDGEPQMILEDVATDEMDHWTTGNKEKAVTYAPVIMQGYQVYQVPEGGVCYGVEMEHLGIVEREAAMDFPADVIDGDRLLWKIDDEAVAIDAVRKATAGWAEEWERAVWTALEGVDLHRART